MEAGMARRTESWGLVEEPSMGMRKVREKLWRRTRRGVNTVSGMGWPDSGEWPVALEADLCRPLSLELSDHESGHSNSWASALIAELVQFKIKIATGKNLMVSSAEIGLMDDFLEMELLAASPKIEHRISSLESGTSSDKVNHGKNPLKAKLEAIINQTTDLEEKLEKMEAKKLRLEIALTQCQQQLEVSQAQFKDTEAKLIELQTKLANRKAQLQISQVRLKDTDI
ncbi:hypothetical protein Ancab_015529, partial [Ancistrocladus abbreviatus]